MSGYSYGAERIRLAAAFAALLTVAAPGAVWAQKFDGVSLPLPVEIDGRSVHCPLYLKLELRRYNTPFDKFAAADKAQGMFATAVEAIRKRDAAKFAGVWTSPDQMKRPSLATTTVAMVQDSPNNWIDAARANFDFDHLTVVAEVLAGSDTMFVWETPTKSGIRRDAFYVGLDQKNRPRLSIVSSNAPVLALIKTAFDAENMSDGQSYQPQSNVHLGYRIPLALAGKGDPGPHPVYLEFDGTPMDFPVGDEKVVAPDPMLASMRKAVLDLRHGRYAAFARDYTPRSQERIKLWLASLAARNQTANPSMAGGGMNQGTAGMQSLLGSNVKFVLNASPVFVVFQSSAPGNRWTSDSLNYTYIFHMGDTYKIANFSSSDDLDDLLQSSTLFDKTALKSAPQTRPQAGTTPNLR